MKNVSSASPTHLAQQRQVLEVVVSAAHVNTPRPAPTTQASEREKGNTNQHQVSTLASSEIQYNTIQQTFF